MIPVTDSDSPVEPRLLSGKNVGSIPTAPTNIFFCNSELQICEGA